MAAPRKVFRIEEMAATRLPQANDDAQPPSWHAALMAELAGLRGAVAALTTSQSGDGAPRHDRQPARLCSEFDRIGEAIAGAAGSNHGTRPIPRIAHELEEVFSSTERATQEVLAAAEEIDQVANNLSAALTGNYERGLAQDILDLVIRIFEACNFQDLAGQRISKVLSTLSALEAQLSRGRDQTSNVAAPDREGAQYLHGPRLRIDSGHASQADIDLMFDG